MRKPFTAPKLVEEATLSRLTLGGVTSQRLEENT
jgi:hypothetical protein